MDAERRGRPPNGILLLPNEILSEIFTRLSVKTLSKIRCVSKSWRSIISSQEFIKSHLKKWDNDDEFTHHNIILEYYRRSRVRQCSVYSFLNNPEITAARIDDPVKIPPHFHCKVVGSCNGLLCLLLDDVDLYLWNPCTRQSKKLSDSGFTQSSCRFNLYGFGYNESNDDYNVVLGLYSRCKRKTEVVIYSLKTDSWRMIDDLPAAPSLFRAGVFVSGKLHWIPDKCKGDCDPAIVSLDLAQMEYGEVQLPRCGKDFLPRLILGKCLCVNFQHRELLCLWNEHGHRKEDMDLLVMKEYGVVESWIKLASIPPPSAPLCITGKGELLLSSRLGFGLYNLGDKSMRYPKIEDVDGFYLGNTIYVESLVSPVSDRERLHGHLRQE